MARKYGRCANYGECTLADTHKVIDSTEDNFICTECGKPLRAATISSSPSGNNTRVGGGVPKWAIPLLAILLLIGGGFAAWKFWSNSSSTTMSSSTIAPVSPNPVSKSQTITSPIIKSLSSVDVKVGDKFDYVINTEPQADKFIADKLPDGVLLDEKEGKLSGVINTAGDFTVKLTAEKDGQISPVFPLLLSVKAKEASPNIILRLHGSNTIGANLAPELVTAFLKDKGYTDIEKVPVAEQEVLIKGKNISSGELEAVEIKAHGSATAFDETDKNKQVGLLGGYADVGMASTSVKPDVIAKFEAKNLGNLGSRAQEHVIALDGLAVIVNPNNKLDKLSVDKIRKIFLGEFNDWSQVGGTAGVIKLYARDKQSGTYDTFKHLVLSGQALECDKQASLKCFEDSKDLAANVASDLNGIGFVGLNYIGTTKALKVSMGDNVNALPPTRFTIKTEDYPLSRRLFLYQTNQPKPLAAEFIQFALSNAGQKVVNATGLVEVAIENDNSPPVVAAIDSDKQAKLDNPNVPQAYKNLIRNADQHDTQLNFRFQSGAADLDNRAFRDVGRLSEKLSKPEFANAKLILIGFADPKGDAVKNLELSKQRANQVKNELEAEGLKVQTTTGFGEEPSLLLDPREDEPESLAKNRRVEVWLQK